MSLFGTSPDAPTPSAPNRSIFGDDAPPPATSSSSLFADNGGDDSPWSMPTPKRNARQNLVKTLLPATTVPDHYIDSFDLVLNSADRDGSGIGLTAIKNILATSNISAANQNTILDLVVPGGRESSGGLGRNEFNVLLALIGLAQEGDEITLDSVDERRRNLPRPNIDFIEKLRSKPQEPSTQSPSKEPQSSPPTTRPGRKIRQDSLDPTSDPWASSIGVNEPPPSTAAHTMQTTTISENYASSTNGVNRTTSAFTTGADSMTSSGDVPRQTQSAGSDGAGWTGYNGGGGGGFADQTPIGGGFAGGDNQSQRPKHRPQPSLGSSIVVPPGTGELVTITLLPDKEGTFLFQHHNYEVKTIRRGSTVVRRYSDFVWLLDCLQKRYPFRRLPLLPPKRVQVNGNHLAADTSTFLERRRKGLTRFSNTLVQHPILSQETLVVMFLTVPTELSVWRKQATISVQEEFVGKALPPDLEDSLPSSLPELFDQVRAGVKRSSEVYINLSALLERLIKRKEGLAADNLRFSLALETLTEGHNDAYAVDTNDVPLLDEGIKATSKHLSQSQSLLDDEAKAWESGVLEDMKTLRDHMVSMRDVFDRRDKYARDNIPQLERRIQASETKLQTLRNKAPGQVKAGEMEKVEGSIISDKESIVQQHARGVFIRECIRDEIITFQSTIYVTSRMHQDWSQERVKYAELQASNWRALVEQLESMPVGES